jgi:hypothetical protein
MQKPPTETTDHLYRTIRLGLPALSRLAWLCDREVRRLQKFSDENASDPESEDDVAEADNDRTFWAGIAGMLRECRNG